MPEPEVVADLGHADVKWCCLTGCNVQGLHQPVQLIMGEGSPDVTMYCSLLQ